MQNVTESRLRHVLYDLLFLLVMVLAGYLRLSGANWGEGQHQHPDENHFSGVLDSLRAHKCVDGSTPVDACPPEQRRWIGIGDYLNTDTSPLSPYNHGYSFYVYGNLPMTIVRVAAEAGGETNLRLFGRQSSALADLFAIFFLYLIVSRLYGRKVGVLASLFSSLAVMQIQQSHFFTVDLFVNTFAFLAIYFAVMILTDRQSSLHLIGSRSSQKFIRNPLVLHSIGFGIALGMAMASKINIAPLALLLPVVFVIRHFITDRQPESGNNEGDLSESGGSASFVDQYWRLIVVCLVVGAVATIISFRFFQPYAFKGIGLNPQWVANIREQRIQATGGADVPWELQWARRTHFYSFENLTLWGLGLPLGILAWTGFFYMGWRIFKGDWRHAPLWGWTALYFIWQSLQFNPTMRYQLPVYPLLAMMAAWFVFELAKPDPTINEKSRTLVNRLRSVAAVIIGVAVIAFTAAWAFAFQSIYTRVEPRMAASRWIYQNIPGPVNLVIESGDSETYNQPLPFPAGTSIQSGFPYNVSFVAQSDGLLDSILLPHVLSTSESPSTLTLTLGNASDPTFEQASVTGNAIILPPSGRDPRGDAFTVQLSQPVALTKGAQYNLRFEVSEGMIALAGASFTNETDYDYTLPFRVDGYDAFGGIYRGDLNLQVYWDDNPDKLDRFVNILSQSDYILIPTNHQYAQITRLPERYPLTTSYYRELMGCPPGAEIIPCYHEATPGDHKGRLGFELVAVFETFPKLGPFEINDEYAEEAFTFYDHPKAFIFKKNADFDPKKLEAILGAVDTSNALHLTPHQFENYSASLLPADRLARQRAGGTWSELFNYDWIQNRFPVLGLLIWYVFIFILGLITYPVTRLAMPGLGDKGYPLSRALGLVIFGYFAWLAGSAGIPYTRTTIGIVFGILSIIGAVAGYWRRGQLMEEWKTKRKYLLTVEGLFLLFFLFDLFIRIGNPDLWHLYKGGERPMDFSYFNAVLKSTSFPPYDPWFAGGHINYYYYGFVLVATPVKLLGIVPTIAYNFILPTLFAMVALCAFSIGWNLIASQKSNAEDDQPLTLDLRIIAGLGASFLTILLGNLGTIQLLYNRLQQLGALGTFVWESTFTQRVAWAFAGLKMLLNGATLPIGPGDWYWDPSRVVPPGPGNAITEFPLFTFIYSDLHAHMMVMPIALLALGWALSVLMTSSWWTDQAPVKSERWLSVILSFLVGALVIGAVYPTNLSDAYTYLLTGMIVLAYSTWRFANVETVSKRILVTVGAVIVLYALSKYMYAPYRAWYAQAYSALDPWKGPFTPLASYFTHWGLFLFIVVSWLTWETRQWMASTPISALRKLKPYQILIEGGLIAFVVVLFVLQYLGTSVGWIALPIAAWAGVLMLNPKTPDTKRFVYFLIGTALFITVLVDVVVVRGDIGRQNTIFKFYLQAWLMLAVSAGAALAWTLPGFFKWLPGWRAFWQTAMILLVAGAAMYTVTAADGKIRDRWVLEAPHTLDSMTFMQYVLHDDFGQRLDLSEDYRAIRWMQDNVQGSPVIVEANCTEYRWCTRFTIYTGLPGVVGWNFHQRQQRAFTSFKVEERVAAIGNFYNSLDLQFARDFLKTHAVKYIIVGQLERAAYTPEGIAKFEQNDGQYWKSVYRYGSTVIYEVLP